MLVVAVGPRPISDRETIMIRAYEPLLPSPERRSEVIAGLEAHFATLDATRQPTAIDEADASLKKPCANLDRITGRIGENCSGHNHPGTR